MRPQALDETVARAGGFLSDIQCRPLEDDSALLVESVFHLAAYQPELYPALRIARPPCFGSMAPKRQADFLAGRVMASVAQAAFALPIEQISVGPDRAPVWPAGLSASLSHGNDRVACLATPNDRKLVGVDLEDFASGDLLTAILAECLQPTERRAATAQSHLTLDAAATLLFSAKETIFKALYPVVQRFFGFEKVVLSGCVAGETLEFELIETLHPQLPAGFSFGVCSRLSSRGVLTWLVMDSPFLQQNELRPIC